MRPNAIDIQACMPDRMRVTSPPVSRFGIITTDSPPSVLPKVLPKSPRGKGYNVLQHFTESQPSSITYTDEDNHALRY